MKRMKKLRLIRAIPFHWVSQKIFPKNTAWKFSTPFQSSLVRFPALAHSLPWIESAFFCSVVRCYPHDKLTHSTRKREKVYIFFLGMRAIKRCFSSFIHSWHTFQLIYTHTHTQKNDKQKKYSEWKTWTMERVCA